MAVTNYLRRSDYHYLDAQRGTGVENLELGNYGDILQR